jgi:mRNA interferase RelE/StbE
MVEIVFMPSARRQWMKLSSQTRDRIRSKLLAFAETGQGDVKKMKGQDGSRLRIGDWRVIFDQQQQTIIVVSVGHRREIYD